jgi:hypothetical protein
MEGKEGDEVRLYIPTWSTYVQELEGHIINQLGECVEVEKLGTVIVV